MQVDLGQLGRTQGERFRSDANSGSDGAAKIIPIGGNGIKGGGGAKINNARRTAIQLISGGGIHDPVGAKLSGIIMRILPFTVPSLAAMWYFRQALALSQGGTTMPVPQYRWQQYPRT
jgi:hypothetical protein